MKSILLALGIASLAAISSVAFAAPPAPEIDGSLAPKVGFLLGCLFLMCGRKRENTDPR